MSFRPEFMALHLVNLDVTHEATHIALQQCRECPPGDTLRSCVSRSLVTVAKRRIAITQNRYASSPQFREAIRDRAYLNPCAVRGVQLELIEAGTFSSAQPPRSRLDTVSNGIAL